MPYGFDGFLLSGVEPGGVQKRHSRWEASLVDIGEILWKDVLTKKKLSQSFKTLVIVESAEPGYLPMEGFGLDAAVQGDWMHRVLGNPCGCFLSTYNVGRQSIQVSFIVDPFFSVKSAEECNADFFPGCKGQRINHHRGLVLGFYSFLWVKINLQYVPYLHANIILVIVLNKPDVPFLCQAGNIHHAEVKDHPLQPYALVEGNFVFVDGSVPVGCGILRPTVQHRQGGNVHQWLFICLGVVTDLQEVLGWMTWVESRVIRNVVS